MFYFSNFETCDCAIHMKIKLAIWVYHSYTVSKFIATWENVKEKNLKKKKEKNLKPRMTLLN